MDKLEYLEKELVKANSRTPRNCVAKVYPSMLTKMCTRFFCLLGDTKVKEADKFMTVGMAMTFEIGNAMQTILERSLKPLIKATEIPMTYDFTDKIKLSGRLDILFKDGEIWEVKSIKSETFDTLTEATKDHAYQLQSYLWAIKKENPTKYKINTDAGRVIYMAKEFKKQPFKAFEVTLSPEFCSFMDGIESTFKLHESTGELPDRRCKSDTMSMAKNCPLFRQCFREDKPLDIVRSLYD